MGINVTYQEEKIAAVMDEMQPLLKNHWEEVADHKDVRPLDPDWNMYLSLNDMDILRMYTIRVDGKLVGYSTWIISNNLHYKTWKDAVNDVYYLDPVHRKTGLSYYFFFKISDWLKSFQVNSITINDRVKHPHAKFFNQLGYTVVEHNYEKVI